MANNLAWVAVAGGSLHDIYRVKLQSSAEDISDCPGQQDWCKMIETVKESGGGIKSDANQLKAVSECKIEALGDVICESCDFRFL